VGYHYMFLIFTQSGLSLHVSDFYPNFNEVVSVVPTFIWAVVICPNIYYICKSE